MKRDFKQFVVNLPIKNYKKGQIIFIEFIDGKAKNKYWRDRLRDAEFDNCLEEVKGEESSYEKLKNKKVKQKELQKK